MTRTNTDSRPTTPDLVERPPVDIDPATGRKRFNTRARSFVGPPSWGGYAVVKDDSLKVLPEAPTETRFDEQARARYDAYKQERQGTGTFVALAKSNLSFREDPFATDPVPREALHDECDVLVIGAGFAGLMLWYKLQQAGFNDVRFCDKGGDVGGTWYFNRYPGVACDVEAYSYLPLLEEMEYIPPMKFASGFEIYEYCQRMAERFGFYDRCLFHTMVNGVDWDAETERWVVTTDRGDSMRARFVVLANGILTTPKLAQIDGMESFRGESFHTSRWEYDIDLEGKTVGIIGTGATAVQVIPEIAKVARHLFVFQRTPSTVDVRDQRETTTEERATWPTQPNWARQRRARFARISAGRAAMKANDDYLAGKVDSYKEVKEHAQQISPSELMDRQLESNFRIMEQIRARIDAIVHDPETARALKPYYPYGCKRPTFHDEYLPTFNRPNVTLVDTAPRGVSEIDERGVVHDGKHYPVDVLIYATGYEWLSSLLFESVRGVDGRSIREKWDAQGTSTFLGLHSRGFPNLFVVTGPQGGGGSFNFTDGIDAHTDYVVWMLSKMRDAGYRTVDVREDDEHRYMEHCREMDIATAPLRNCLSYNNGYGTAKPGSLAYFGGANWHVIRREAQETLAPYELK